MGACNFVTGNCQSFGIAANAQDIYWTSVTAQTVNWAVVRSQDFGEPASGGNPLGIACDSASFYWTDIQQGTVTQEQLSGSVNFSVPNQISPAGIAVDANNIYWTTLGTVDAGGTVMATPIGGAGAGSPQTLAAGQALPFGIATDMVGNVYWQNLGTPPGYIDGTIMEAQGDGGGTPLTLATGQISSASRSQGPVDTLAVNGENLYWIANNDVMWLQLQDGALARLGLGGAPEGIALDDTSLYYTLGSSVWSIPINASGAPVAIATGQSSPGAIAVSSAGVFWSSYAITGTCPVQGVPLP